jgi:hypothetical protein
MASSSAIKQLLVSAAETPRDFHSVAVRLEITRLA